MKKGRTRQEAEEIVKTVITTKEIWHQTWALTFLMVRFEAAGGVLG